MWRAIDDERFRPAIVVIEYNSHMPPSEAKTVPFDSGRKWDGYSAFFGASLLAISRLACVRRYTLVHCDSHGVNAFYVANEILFRSSEKGTILPTDSQLRDLVDVHYRQPNFYNRGWSYPDPTATSATLRWEEVAPIAKGGEGAEGRYQLSEAAAA